MKTAASLGLPAERMRLKNGWGVLLAGFLDNMRREGREGAEKTYFPADW
jgi:hypothetical protein